MSVAYRDIPAAETKKGWSTVLDSSRCVASCPTLRGSSHACHAAGTPSACTADSRTGRACKMSASCTDESSDPHQAPRSRQPSANARRVAASSPISGQCTSNSPPTWPATRGGNEMPIRIAVQGASQHDLSRQPACVSAPRPVRFLELTLCASDDFIDKFKHPRNDRQASHAS